MIIGACGICYVQNVLRKIEQPQYLGVGGSGKLVDFQSAITGKNGLRILGCLQQSGRFQHQQLPTIFQNNRNGSNLVKMEAKVVSWGLPKRIGKIYIKSNY